MEWSMKRMNDKDKKNKWIEREKEYKKRKKTATTFSSSEKFSIGFVSDFLGTRRDIFCWCCGTVLCQQFSKSHVVEN